MYSLYLMQLVLDDRYEQVISACRTIRRIAARGPGLKEGIFTFSLEIDALYELQQYQTAFKQLCQRDRIIFGERMDFAKRKWSRGEGWQLEFDYAPIHYFLGRYRLGCSLLETALGFWFDPSVSTKPPCFQILYRICNNEHEPSHRCRVTLAHFYNRLGKPMTEWKHWPQFVNGLNLKLFRIAGITRAQLLMNSDHLPMFFDKLMKLRDQRIPTRIGNGELDLTDSAKTVRQRQAAIQKKSELFEERTKLQRERREAKLRDLFPELRDLQK